MSESCLKKLAKGSVRLTKNRQVILDVLHAAEGPLSPPAIVERCHHAGRKAHKTTIYRELEVLIHAGIVHRVMVSDRAQYFELTERGHHHHFVCQSCERVEDVAIEDDQLLVQAKRLGQRLSFQIEQHAVEFYGRCAACTHT